MYDAIDASLLPTDGDLYAGYVDGNWPSYDAIKARFPGKLVVGIATNPNTNNGTIGDGPPDNGAWPAWINWVKMRRAAGVDPTMYTDQSLWTTGIGFFQQAGVAEPHWWVANYDGNPTIAASAVAKQFASNNDYDTSSVRPYWPGVDPAPVPPKPPVPPVTPQEEEDMLIIYVDGETAVYGLSGGRLWHIADVASLESYQAVGVKSVHVTQAEFANIKGQVV